MSEKRSPFSRFFPRSLSGQLMLSLLAALIIAHIISFLILADERYGAIASAQRDQIMARTASILWVLEETPGERRQKIADAASTFQLRFRVERESALDSADAANTSNLFARRLARMLERSEGEVLVAFEEHGFWRWWHDDSFRRHAHDHGPWHDDDDDFHTERRWHEEEDDDDHEYEHDDDDNHEYDHDDHDDHEDEYGERLAEWDWREGRYASNLTLSVRLSDYEWLNAEYRVFRPQQGLARASLLTVGLVGIAVCLVTFLMLRRLTRPLKSLASAAETLGRGEDIPPLDETGPAEIRQTTAAFNHMKDRLKRFVDDRTRMLAAISHDLRTPLTSLRLRAEMLEDGETKEKILETLEEMKRMTEATLAFAREDASNEETRDVDLSALIESIVLDFQDLGRPVMFDNPGPFSFRCRPFGLKRAIRNLVENAIQYGGEVTVKLSQTDTGMRIDIDDNGPGIPEEDFERVFEPFVRMEQSRSRDTGGIGLGLAIARTIVRSHGGDITLNNRPQGGLTVSVNLPSDNA